MSSADHRSQPDLRESARRAVPFAALSGAMQIVLSVVGMFLLVRYFSPDLYGAWVILIGFAPPVLLFTSIGYRHSLIRFMPAMDTPDARRQFLWFVTFRRFALALAAFVAMAVAFPLFGERFGVAEYQNAFLVLVPALVSITTNQYAISGLNVIFRQREVFLGSLAYQITNLAAVGLGIYLQLGIFYFAAAYSLLNVVYLLLNLAICGRFFGVPSRDDLFRRRVEGKQEKTYRRTSFIDDVGTSLMSVDINRLVLAAFSTNPQVAVFAVASGITERLRAFMPMEIFRPLATVTFFGKYEESNKLADVNRMFAFLLAINRLLTTAYLVLFIPLGAEALAWIFREEYVEAYWPALLLFIAMGVFGMPIGLVAQALQRPQALVYSKLAVLLNLGLGIPLSIHYGAVGMALATTLAELARSLIVFGMLRLEFQITYPWLGTLRFSLAAVVVGALLWWLESFMPLPAAAGVGVVAWACAIRLFRVLDAYERNLATSLVPARFQPMARLLVGT